MGITLKKDVYAQSFILKSAAVETVPLFSCLWLRRHNGLSPGEVAARAVLEKTQVIFDQLAGEEKKKMSSFGLSRRGHCCVASM